MSTVQEILEAINALDHIEEEDFHELILALRALAEDCGIDVNARLPEGDDDYDFDEDYDDDEEEDDEDDFT